MSILPIYLYGSEVLRKKAKPVHELDDSLIKLAYDMTETMQKANGIGLAATQVGDMRRVIVINLSAVEDVQREREEEEGTGEDQSQPDVATEDLSASGRDEPPAPKKALALINPLILEESGSWALEEGCLSIPDVRADVSRSAAIRVRFRDANFREVEITADGWLARVILHEIDHLDGVLFIDRISAAKRALLRNELRKIKRGDVETSYPVVSAVEV
jgi:peptide deformylase